MFLFDLGDLMIHRDTEQNTVKLSEPHMDQYLFTAGIIQAYETNQKLCVCFSGRKRSKCVG